MFTDDYYDKEENTKLFEFFLKYLLSDEVTLDNNISENTIQDYAYVPEITELAENLKSCLE